MNTRYDMLLCDADDTLFDFGRAEENAFADACARMGLEATDALLKTYSDINAALWRLLEQGERDFDELCEAVGLPSDELGAILMMMDMDGVIRALPGLRYALP